MRSLRVLAEMTIHVWGMHADTGRSERDGWFRAFVSIGAVSPVTVATLYILPPVKVINKVLSQVLLIRLLISCSAYTIIVCLYTNGAHLFCGTG